MTDYEISKRNEYRTVPPEWSYVLCGWLMGGFVVGFFYAYGAALLWC